MKSSEFHRWIKKNGWEVVRVAGSHYMYQKNGKTIPVPTMVQKKWVRVLENHWSNKWS